MKKNIYLIILMAICSACAINYPALPSKNLSSSDELKFIYTSDQKDRKRTLFKMLTTKYERAIKEQKIIMISDRDSVRLARVIDLHHKNYVISNQDKFYAAAIYNHAGGLKMNQDSAYFRAAYLLFRELHEKGFKKKLTNSLMNTSYERWQYELKDQ